jgi:CBS-domain-containing membrane protein
VLDTRFVARKRRYLLQAGLGTAALAVLLVCQDALANAAIVAAIAATTFLVFVNPNATMAQPRRILGGYAAALAVASVFSVVVSQPALGEVMATAVVRDGAAALAVGSGMLVMAVTNTEHAPAAGTVLGLVFEPWTVNTAVAVVFAALVLATMRVLLRPLLVDLI